MYTAGEILQYTYDAVKALYLPIKGKLYKAGNRIAEGIEDMTIGVLNGTADQVQEGTININVFVPDVSATDGRYYCNSQRCLEIEKMLSDIDKKLNTVGDIRYDISDMIMTNQESKTQEHYVNVSLRYRVLNN